MDRNLKYFAASCSRFSLMCVLLCSEQLDEESGSALGSIEIYLREAQLEIDFSDLPAELTVSISTVFTPLL